MYFLPSLISPPAGCTNTTDEGRDSYGLGWGGLVFGEDILTSSMQAHGLVMQGLTRRDANP